MSFKKGVAIIDKFVVKEVTKGLQKWAEEVDDKVCNRNEEEKKEIRALRRRLH